MSQSGTHLDVSSDKLYSDIKSLIFEDCKDTTPWDHLGNLEPVRKQTTKHVSFDASPARSESKLERIDLPPGLALMYSVRSAQDPLSSNLLKLLRIAALPPPPPDHCIDLYDRGMARYARLKAEEEERIRLAEEEEDSHCTFHPQVSETSKGNHTKESLDKFFERTTEWQKNRAKKLEAKKKKEAKVANEEFAEMGWEMSAKTKKLAENYRRKKEELKMSPQRTNRVMDGYINPTFMPVTNSASRIEDYYIRPATKRGSADDTSTENSEPPEIAGTMAGSMIIERMEADLAGRRQRKEERAKLYLAKQKERLYDKITGQPLFVPNAMPMIEIGKDGVRVPYHELTASQKKEYHKKCQSNQIDIIPDIATRTSNKPMRDIEQHVKDMCEREREGKKAIARIKRKEDAELTKLFVPNIESKSAEIASSNEHRQPVYKLPLPRKHDDVSESETPKKHSCGRSIRSMLERAEHIKAKKQSDFEKVKAKREQEKVQGATHKPQLNRHSVSLVANAESRYAAEVAQDSQPRSMSYASPSFRQSSMSVASSPNLQSTHGSVSKRPRSTPAMTAVSPQPYNMSSAPAASPQSYIVSPVPNDPALDIPKEEGLDDVLSSWQELDRLTDAALGL